MAARGRGSSLVENDDRQRGMPFPVGSASSNLTGLSSSGTNVIAAASAEPLPTMLVGTLLRIFTSSGAPDFSRIVTVSGGERVIDRRPLLHGRAEHAPEVERRPQGQRAGLLE